MLPTISSRSHFLPNLSVSTREVTNGKGTEAWKQGSEEAKESEGSCGIGRFVVFNEGRLHTNRCKEKIAFSSIATYSTSFAPEVASISTYIERSTPALGSLTIALEY